MYFLSLTPVYDHKGKAQTNNVQNSPMDTITERQSEIKGRKNHNLILSIYPKMCWNAPASGSHLTGGFCHSFILEMNPYCTQIESFAWLATSENLTEAVDISLRNFHILPCEHSQDLST
jgi:hypothetical protein